jgi:hypothetical protein
MVSAPDPALVCLAFEIAVIKVFSQQIQNSQNLRLPNNYANGIIRFCAFPYFRVCNVCLGRAGIYPQ